MSIKKINEKKTRKRFFKEAKKLEDLYTLTKMISGIITGILLGFLKIIGVLGFLIGIGIIVFLFLVFRYLLGLKDIHPARLLLWDGTFSFFILMIMTWALVFNLTVQLP